MRQVVDAKPLPTNMKMQHRRQGNRFTVQHVRAVESLISMFVTDLEIWGSLLMESSCAPLLIVNGSHCPCCQSSSHCGRQIIACSFRRKEIVAKLRLVIFGIDKMEFVVHLRGPAEDDETRKVVQWFFLGRKLKTGRSWLGCLEMKC